MKPDVLYFGRQTIEELMGFFNPWKYKRFGTLNWLKYNTVKIMRYK